ncbi:MAG: SDR family oxidoreductase, partial [Chitinophagaceae bacterium]|nr:SDR family oxidoreductase [Chitinophagaceae bacterium]
MNIVITGASKGLGRAIAEKFGSDKQGHGLFLCARNEEHLKAFAKELQARYPRTNVQFLACDLGVREQIGFFADWLIRFNIPIDVLVNNAGQFVPGSLYNEEEGIFEKMMQVNLYSAYHLTRALLPSMMERKKGHIFNMCSVASLQAYANGGSYSISKFALLGFSRNLREEMKPHGIKVTSVI